MKILMANAIILSAKIRTPTPTSTLHPQFAAQTTNFPVKISQPEAQFFQNRIHEIPPFTRHQLKVYAARRRRRSNTESDTYVLMEPGENEEFVSEDELRDRLRGWLENWPGKSLPPDLARFDSIDEAVQYLVKSVCELEIDGDVGSIQWYQVRLE